MYIGDLECAGWKKNAGCLDCQCLNFLNVVTVIGYVMASFDVLERVLAAVGDNDSMTMDAYMVAAECY